jgi:hypothetical protein
VPARSLLIEHHTQEDEAGCPAACVQMVLLLNDPALPDAPQRVSVDELMLAWDEFDNSYATLTRNPAASSNPASTP